ncbi:hypothetical protein KYI78_05115 [Providencia rettgeri]|uniref:phage tail fiber protein n=1 Tax=Providencia TaxID=586 RepID=UPI0013743949|nr:MULTISPECIES: hypothetical protein [Providencia]MBW3104599.1 hypothetical protein [Providencia rettgeri]BBU96302.1 hypothetical protein BML2496_21850 [Providencia rettgeri]
MYNTGTVTTTANSTKATGTNTKWKDNNSLVSAEQVILIQNGTTVYINSIASIQSDTELTLSFAAPAAVKNGSYRILTTMVNSISDAANKLVAMNNANAVFSEVLNRMFTETGIITVVLPDGTTLKTKTFAEMDKQLDGKFDKTGGSVEGGLSATGAIQTSGGQVTAHTAGGVGAQLDSRGDIAKIRSRNKNGTWFDHAIPETAGTFMQVGDCGLGGVNINLEGLYGSGQNFDLPLMFNSRSTGLYAWGGAKNPPNVNKYNFLFHQRWSGNQVTSPQAILGMTPEGDLFHYGKTTSESWFNKVTFYSTKNTTKDSNGNLKAASPIIRVFADDVDPNEEAEGVTLKKLHTGIYQLHGVLGLHSDASWGGINGGITIPCGINQLPLVYALYDVLEKGKPHPFDGRIVEPDEDGDIVLYTSYRQHDLPQNIQYERFKLYPEFLRDAIDGEESIPGFNGKVELTPGEPCDIPTGHWVDVRVNMPSNSIYNQKQAEAERLAKLEAERLAQEEAKRAAEEAERAEQEAAERKQYGLGDNDALL